MASPLPGEYDVWLGATLCRELGDSVADQDEHGIKVGADTKPAYHCVQDCCFIARLATCSTVC